MVWVWGPTARGGVAGGVGVGVGPEASQSGALCPQVHLRGGEETSSQAVHEGCVWHAGGDTRSAVALEGTGE